MNICNNECQPNLAVCPSCGRNEEEREVWHILPEKIQQSIAERIQTERAVRVAMVTQSLEITRLNSIIREINAALKT